MAVLIAVAGVSVYGANRALEARVAVAKVSGDVGPLPDGTAVRVLSLGFDRLVADLFWLRTIYYVGDEHAADAGFPAVDRLANLVTDIDPSFRTVYVVMSGAIGGLKGDPDAAIALLEKGIQHVDYWRLHFLLGFNYFLEKLDYARAAQQIEIAATKARPEDGAPPYLPLLAARLYAQAGDPTTALAFIQARLRDEQEPGNKEALQKRYWDLWITRDLAKIDAAIATYKAHSGKTAMVMEELVKSGALAPEPRDPRGGRYRIERGHAATDLPYDPLQVNMPYKPTRRVLPLRPGAERSQEGARP